MKPETKVKIKMKLDHAVNAIKPWIAPITVMLTACAAWTGYSNSCRNERELHRLRDKVDVIDVRLCYAYANLKNKVEGLEEKNEKLLKEAMDITEEKEES